MKRKMKSLLMLLLALAMILSLAACGNKDEDKQEEEEEHPDMVYVADTTPLKSGDLEDGINPVAYTEDGFYATTYGKIGERDPEEGETALYEGYFDIYGYKLFFIKFDGTVTPLSNYAPMEAPENTENKTSYYSGTGLNTLFVRDDGSLLALENVYIGWFDGTEEEMIIDSPSTLDKYKNYNEYYLRVLNSDGSEKSSVRLDFDAQDMWMDFSRSVFDKDGNLLVVGDSNVLAFGMDGTLKYQLNLDFWPDGMVKLRDGTVALTGWSQTGSGMCLYPINAQKKSLDKPLDIPMNAYSPMPGDDTYDFYYLNGMYLCGYNLETKEDVKLLNWMDLDINGNTVSGVKIQPDGTIDGVINQWKNGETIVELFHVHQVPYDSVPHKETMTLAVLYAYELYDKVIDFNRHNDKVRIQIVDYSEYNDYENDDYDAGRTKLLTEIMSGSMPDLVMMSQLPYEQMAAKGLLEDLYPYIDQDQQLKRTDFFPNALKALEINGGLYQVVPSFNVMTLIGATSVVGDKPGWTYKDLQAALATMPEGCDPLDMYITRDDILQTLLSADLDHYVDWTTGTCSFDSEDFRELLAFARQFPASIPDDLEWEDTSTRIAEGRQMLTTAYLYSVDSMLWNDVQFGEAGCTYIGYPTNNGVGSVMQFDTGYAMSASCKNKEVAWQFLRSFLLPEGQEDVWGIPIRLDAYQKMLDEVMTPQYEQDENGNYVLDENGEKIEIPRGGYWMEDGSMMNIYAMTQEQADKLWEAITTCTKIQNNDTSIMDIVMEQAQAYFAGQKTAEEVSRLIQSKVNIYVNERR